MLRVISGKYKGKKLIGFDLEGTRPTQDRVKMSVFSMIQEKISDSTVLDLFAGTGNLGIEAISNGARHVTFVDSSKNAIRVIQKNTEKIQENYAILLEDYQKVLDRFSKENRKFDIIFLDPPYQMDNLSSILEFLVKKDLLEKSSLVICELEHDHLKDNYGPLVLWKEKKYGYKQVKIYRREKFPQK